MRIKYLAYLFIAVGCVLALWFLSAGGYIKASFIPSPEKAKEIQPFMTGLVAPLFALAGTILVFENLRNQIDQQVLNGFFGMINLHYKIAEHISVVVYGINEPEIECKGREFFDDLALRIYVDYYGAEVRWKDERQQEKSIQPIKDDGFDNKIGLDRLNAIYAYYFDIYTSSLGHYFRNLFHIVKYIDESKLGQKQKKANLRILRAQLSNYEILVLGYNGLSLPGKNFKPLIEKYELLKNLNFEENLSRVYIKRIIEPNILIAEYPHLKNRG